MFLYLGITAAVVAIVVLFFHQNVSRSLLFAFFHARVMAPRLAAQLAPVKEELFEVLKTLKSNDPELKSSNSLRILEIGVGSGINLPYYPKGARLITVEPNPHFEYYFFRNLEKFPVPVDRFIRHKAEDLAEVEDGSVDVVVSTYVLCSVEDSSQVLKEIVRVLAPGGRFLYLEHVPAPEGSWERMFQKFFHGGHAKHKCHKSHGTSALIRNAGFASVDEKIVHAPRFFSRRKPNFVGSAIK